MKKTSLVAAIYGVCSLSLVPLAEASSTSLEGLNFFPNASSSPARESQTRKSKRDTEQLAREFLKQQRDELGIESVDQQLQLHHVKSSLLADHYYFAQTFNNIPIFQKQIVVSVDRNRGVVTKVHNQLAPHWLSVSAIEKLQQLNSTSSDKQAPVSAEKALAISWDALGKSGSLAAKPSSQSVYYAIGKRLVLSHLLTIEKREGDGSWRFLVDAKSGDVLLQQRLDTPHKGAASSSKHTKSSNVNASFHANNAKGQLSYQAALESYERSENASKKSMSTLLNQTAVLADATGLVFNPDPRTTLNDEAISPSDDASVFEPAYESVTLRDVTLDNGIYSLEGPWVTIVDFEAPNTRPSTTNDGDWRGKRGEDSFYDVMSYFHIDQSQRYIQSLGFSGATGIQDVQIEVDSNGVGGADNSYYLPQSNQLSFGHGCVPDNEDADVILHEYGHAINFDINPDWSGGDTGAMGEGFGDYWAGSYSYSTPNGQTMRPEWVYTWDGHNTCWNGRVMNRTSYRFDESIFYTAHQTIDGQPDYSDELWGTPLFQSLVELIDAGETRDSVDQIVLEGQFGLGANLRMPDLANSIVAAAVLLQPEKSHASVFYNNFRMMEILSEPLTMGTLFVEDPGSNGAADPGETISITIPLQNSAQFDATGATGILTASASTIGITGDGLYPTIEAGGSGSNSNVFKVTIPREFSCGTDIDMSLAVNYQLQTDTPRSESQTFDFSIPTGTTDVRKTSESPEAAIPDNDATGISSTITITDEFETIDNNLSIDIDVAHTWRGDLTITLTSPEGTSVTLWDSDENDSTPNLVGTFPSSLISAESLTRFNDESPNGDWTLTIVDTAAEDVGTLNNWSLNLSSEPACESVKDNDESTRNALYGLALIIIVGVHAGSMHGVFLLLVAGRFRKRHQ